MKKVFFVVLILTVSAVVIVTVMLFFGPTPSLHKVPSPSPTSTLLPNSQNNYRSYSENYFIDSNVKEKQKREYLVSRLINEVPFRGTFFVLDYNFGTAIFTVGYEKGHVSEANKEFILFLKQKNIEDSSWFENLNIQYF